LTELDNPTRVEYDLGSQDPGLICRLLDQTTVASSIPTDQHQVPAGALKARARVHPHTAIRGRRLRTYRVLDIAMLVLASAVAVTLRPGAAEASDVFWAAAYVAATLAILQIRGFYRFRIHDTAVDAIARIFAATSIAAMSLTFARALLTDGDLTGQTLRQWGFALLFLGTGRLAITLDRRLALKRGELGLNTLIVGSGSLGHQIADRLRQRPELGLRPIGFLDKEPLIDRSLEENGLPVLGASWDMESVVRRNNVEQVIVTFSTAPHAVLLGMIRQCRELGVEVAVVPRLFEEVNRRVEVEHLGGIPLLRAAVVDPRGWQFSIKYALDRVIAGFALLLASPLFIALTVAVRLSSPGPIFYRQQRIGLDGHEFAMLKFRSMRIDDDASEFVPEEGLAPGGVEGLDRRTAIGRFMRRYSLDEMPQLLNVLRGDMSLVGPRPERTRFVRTFEEHVYRYGDRHRVKSGLTGWAQVQGLRGQTSLSDRVEWDNYYIENWSLWFDLKIVISTIPAVLGRADVV
jgi:exopolysaccharide biosynthesis polyprenyl glycosylphosphotransferase